MGVVLVVRIGHTTVDRNRTAVFAQFSPINRIRLQTITGIGSIAEIIGAAVSFIAPTPAVRPTQRVIRLITETRTNHQILILRDFPFQTTVETVVIRLRIGISARGECIDIGRFIPPVCGRPVFRIGVVEEIATLKRHLVAFSPRIGIIQTESVHRCHAALRTGHELTDAAATSATATRNAQNILEREILLVDVVEQPDERNPTVTTENIGITSGHVLEFVFGFRIGIVTESGIKPTELSLTHTGTGHDIQCLVAFAVIHARELGRIAQLVVDFDSLDRLGRQRLDGRRDIFTEKLLPVDIDFLDLLALRFDRTVVYGDTGHLLQKALDIGIVRHFESRGIVAYRIAFLRGAHLLHLLDNGFDAHTGLQFQFAEILLCRCNTKFSLEIVIAQKLHRKRIGPISQRWNGHDTRIGRCEILFLLRIGRRYQCHDRTGNAFARIAIDDSSRNPSLLGPCRHRRK